MEGGIDEAISAVAAKEDVNWIEYNEKGRSLAQKLTKKRKGQDRDQAGRRK